MSKYEPLQRLLREQQTKGRTSIKLTFAKIVTIIGAGLPQSAYATRQWWANNPNRHTQSQCWLAVGWQVGEVDLTNEWVLFTYRG